MFSMHIAPGNKKHKNKQHYNFSDKTLGAGIIQPAERVAIYKYNYWPETLGAARCTERREIPRFGAPGALSVSRILS